MASSPPQAPFDMRTLSVCPIRLGPSAQQQSPSSRSGYIGVQYNHKPTSSDSKNATASINPPSPGSRLHSLTLQDDGEEYIYSGAQGTGENSFVLLPQKDGDGYVLEKLDSSFVFNLTNAPWESDAKLLAQRYPQLSPASDDEDEGDLFGDEVLDDLENPDPDNPFDFRHYLHTTDSPSPQSHPTKTNMAVTPLSIASQASTRTSTPLPRAARKPTSAFALQERKAKPKSKSKPTEKQQTQSKRAKSSPKSEKTRNSTEIPAVRLDRRASTRVAAPSNNNNDDLSLDMDDDGDLILEGDEPPSHRNQSSFGLALPTGLGGNGGGGAGGPRSLRSAASSPVSYSASPHPPPHRQSPYERYVDTDGEEIEMDVPSDEHEQEEADAESDGELHMDDADAEADEDVDEMHLPSPAQEHRPSVSNTVVTVDDDDDLENQMILALEGGDDESEESEEE